MDSGPLIPSPDSFLQCGSQPRYLQVGRGSSEKWSGFPPQLGAEQTVTQALARGPHRSTSHGDSVGWALSMENVGAVQRAGVASQWILTSSLSW